MVTAWLKIQGASFSGAGSHSTLPANIRLGCDCKTRYLTTGKLKIRPKMFCNIANYKTFYGCNLQILVMS